MYMETCSDNKRKLHMQKLARHTKIAYMIYISYIAADVEIV